MEKKFKPPFFIDDPLEPRELKELRLSNDHPLGKLWRVLDDYFQVISSHSSRAGAEAGLEAARKVLQ